MDGIIFDVDGTLWDSTEVVARAWTAQVKHEENIDMEITAERLRSLFGQLLPDIAKQLFPELPEEHRLSLINSCCEAEHRALAIEGAPLYEDLRAVLETLSRHFPLFIVSNCQAGYIELFLKKTGLEPLFRGHLCPGDTGEAKAENILRIAKMYHLSAPVYVGDTSGDQAACRKAGIPFVYAAYGFGDVEAPDYRIEKPADLLKLFCTE